MRSIGRDQPRVIRANLHLKQMQPSALQMVQAILGRPGITNFASGAPDPDLFPAERIRDAADKVLRESSVEGLQYGGGQGHMVLRRLLADRMRAKGVPCGPENILVTTGSTQAIELCAQAFAESDAPTLVESPSYFCALRTFRALGVPVRELAGDPPAGSAVPGLAYVVSDCANPTGKSLPEDMRLALLERAHRQEFAILEDAAYADLCFASGIAKSILQLDCEMAGSIERTRTLYCGTLSKVLAPGLRIGWICAAVDLIALLLTQKQNADGFTSMINQLTAADILGEGIEDHIRRLRSAYSAKMDAMLQSMSEVLPPEVSFQRPDGGMFVWVTLPVWMDTEELLGRCVERSGVAYLPGREFFAREDQRNHLRLNFVSNPAPTARAALIGFGDLLREEIASHRSEP